MKHIYIILNILLFIYTILKTRDEFGCKRTFTIKKHCNDMNSLYFREINNSRIKTKNDIIINLKKLISAYENVSIWRNCYIIGTIIIFIIYQLLNNKLDKHNLIIIHISIIIIFYIYHNFMHYHVHRVGKNIGYKLLNKL